MFSPADPFVVLLQQETLCVALWGKIGVEPTTHTTFFFFIFDSCTRMCTVYAAYLGIEAPEYQRLLPRRVEQSVPRKESRSLEPDWPCLSPIPVIHLIEA